MPINNTPAFIAMIFCSQIVDASARQASSNESVWRSTGQDDQVRLTFMTPGSDEAELTFTCRVTSGKVRFFVGETSPLKSNERHTGSFTVGTTSSVFAGRTVPNELSGTSSFEGVIASDATIFKVLNRSRTLAIRIGRSFQTLSLKTVGDQAIRFAARCGK
jgi:hypothetical protein